MSGKYRDLLCRPCSHRCTAASTINIPRQGGPLVMSHRLTLTHYHPESTVHSRVYSGDAHSEFRQTFNGTCLPSEYHRGVSLPCKPPLSLTFYYDFISLRPDCEHKIRTFSDTERCPQSDLDSLTLISDFLPGFPYLFFQCNTQRQDT